MSEAEKWFNPVKEFKKTNTRLNKVGCGMCLAKWTQTTIHLQLGRTHSCHHPDTHVIPIDEIKKNPGALHNTAFKKQKRKEMLEGKRPSECNYCWNVEDNSKEFSDRTYKSNEPWSKPHFDEIVEGPWDQDFNPRYVEIGFTNACNFKCSYCGPSFSSKWVEEMNQYGNYPTTDYFNNIEYLKDSGRMPFKQTDYNPYVEAFWKWWPSLYRDLHTFRMTGGEPLLSKDVWKILDFIIDEPNPNSNLTLSVNTNLGVPDKLIDKLIEKINRLTLDGVSLIGGSKPRIKEFQLFTSVDTWGPQAEYIRNGLEFNRFWDNMVKIMEKCPKVSIGIMSTYNALSVPNYHKLIKGVFDLKKQYSEPGRTWSTAVVLDASYLRYPLHQTVQVLPRPWAEQIKYHGELAADHMEIFKHEAGNTNGYTDSEVGKLRRIYDWQIAEQDPVILNKNRANFYRFFNAHDKRRNTNFLKTFPEFEEFWYQCKEISDKL